jgi:hypothetical protein
MAGMCFMIMTPLKQVLDIMRRGEPVCSPDINSSSVILRLDRRIQTLSPDTNLSIQDSTFQSSQFFSFFDKTLDVFLSL